jgi:hypothetical protein
LKRFVFTLVAAALAVAFGPHTGSAIQLASAKTQFKTSAGPVPVRGGVAEALQR